MNKKQPEVKPDSMGGTIESHESYGGIRFDRRTSSGGQNLYGSSIKHSNSISLTVFRSSKRRDLHCDRFYPGDEIVQVEMSPSQFVDAIATMNDHAGVPCTIRHVGRERMDECPEVNQRQVFEEEFRKDVKEASATAAKLVSEASRILAQKTILKDDRMQLLGLLQKLMRDVQANMPFVQTQFNEAMDKTVNEAKGEIEAFFTNKIIALGTEALRNEMTEKGVLLQAPAIDTKQIKDE